jgi:hypothetical protein
MPQRGPGARENAVQRAAIDFLEAVVLPRPLVFAIPNAAKRQKNGKAGNAVPGLKPGMPDLGMLYRQRIYFLEAKADRPHARLSDAQRAMILELGERGHGVCVFKTIEDIRDALRLWGIRTREALA